MKMLKEPVECYRRWQKTLTRTSDNAYMAAILSSDEDVNTEDPLCDRKPILVYESVMFNKTQIADSRKPRILKRAINLLDNALQVYKEYDSIRYDPEPDKEYTAKDTGYQMMMMKHMKL